MLGLPGAVGLAERPLDIVGRRGVGIASRGRCRRRACRVGPGSRGRGLWEAPRERLHERGGVEFGGGAVVSAAGVPGVPVIVTSTLSLEYIPVAISSNASNLSSVSSSTTYTSPSIARAFVVVFTTYGYPASARSMAKDVRVVRAEPTKEARARSRRT